MIKLQTHCHTKGGSPCGHATSEELIQDAISCGYDGVVVTNHYSRAAYDTYPGETHKEKIDYYFSLISDVMKKGTALGLKVFYGTEVRINLPHELFAEYMVYGFEPKFIYDNKPLFELDQKELFELCEKNGLFMYQVHPFRKGGFTGDPKFMHGAEYFNGHVGHYNDNKYAREFCQKHNLIKMSGSDYHDKGQPLLGGIYIPNNINDSVELAKAIMRNEHKVIDDQEIYLKLTTKKEQV